MKVQVMTPEQMEQYEKLKALFAEKDRRYELFPELVATLQGFVDYYQGAKRATLGNGYAYKFYDLAAAALEKAKANQ